MVGGLVFAGSLLFLIWSLIVGNLDFGSTAYTTWIRIAMTVAVAWATFALWQPRLPEWRELRTAELVIFGAPIFLVLVVQYLQISDRGREVRVAFSTGPWCALLFTYAMFIPNSWRRAARIMIPTALAPVILTIVAGWGRQDLPESFWENLSGLGLMLMIVAVVATYGTHVINALRIQAFEASQLGQYRLRELLGSGGMGDVWLAEHQLLKRPCAIKLIDPGRAADPRAQSRFEREVRATAQLSHWNIVEIYDYGRTDDGTFYYVMEYLPGLTLAEIVETHGPMPPARAVHLLRQACAGLHEAHRAGLIHRDIKPGNLIAAHRGGVFDVVKLVDFGLVELRGESVARSWNSASMFSGSPLYMAPEQALGGSQPDVRSDIYSLGAVAYYLLTGRPPFEGSKPLKIVIAHAHDPVHPPSSLVSDIPPELDEILLRCLAKSPDERYSSAQELQQALASCDLGTIWTNELASEWWQNHEPDAFGGSARLIAAKLQSIE